MSSRGPKSKDWTESVSIAGLINKTVVLVIVLFINIVKT